MVSSWCGVMSCGMSGLVVGDRALRRGSGGAVAEIVRGDCRDRQMRPLADARSAPCA
jgi:hypothetical protein